MQAGASEDKVRDVESAEKSPLFAESERAAIAYAEAMTITGQRVTDALFVVPGDDDGGQFGFPEGGHPCVASKGKRLAAAAGAVPAHVHRVSRAT